MSFVISNWQLENYKTKNGSNCTQFRSQNLEKFGIFAGKMSLYQSYYTLICGLLHNFTAF